MDKKKAVPQEKPVRGELLTIEEAAKYIRLGKTSLYHCINKGDIPYFNPPMGKMMVDSADLDDWLHRSKIPAGIKKEVLNEKLKSTKNTK